jgi:hypothetical protein
MQKLATYIMSGRLQATTAVVGFAILAFPLPPFALFSGAALALVTLRLGAVYGLTILAYSALVMGLMSLIALGQAWTGAAYSLLHWLPLTALALVLRYTVLLGLTLQVVIGLGVLAVLVAHLISPDLTEYWTSLLDKYLRPAMIQAEMPAETVDEVLHKVAHFMTGSFVASMQLSMALALFLARWWQALLYNPGGFRDEFLQLRLGYPAALVGLGLFAMAVLTNSTVMVELAVVGLLMFLLQGIAIVHSLCARTKTPAMWLIGFYIVLILALLRMLLAVCALGVVDNFVNIRTRLRGTRKGK